MAKTAFLFPGQGSQSVGMGLDFAENFPTAHAVFREIDAAVATPDQPALSKIIFEGPNETLTLTEFTQPALMAVSLAILKVLLEQSQKSLTDLCQAVAGHSLGEYSALAATGSISLTDTAKLLQQRGRAMQSAVPEGRGAMAALLGMNWDQVATIITAAQTQGAIVSCANDNADGQVVISGEKQGVEQAIELAKSAGLKRAIMLPVSAPFHSSLMQPAAQVMATALTKINLKPPLVPVYNNVSAMPQTEPAILKQHLIEQVAGRVRFRETILQMQQDGFTNFVEIGAGKVLTGLVQRIFPNANCFNISKVSDLKERLAFFTK